MKLLTAVLTYSSSKPRTINILGVIMRALISHKIECGPSSLVSLNKNHSKEKEGTAIAAVILGLPLN